MATIKTSAIGVFLNTGTANAPTWARFRKQSELSIAYESETTEENYIDEDGPTTETERYSVSFDGEYVAFDDDPIFEFLDGIRRDRKTGDDAKTDVLLVYIYDKTGTGSSATYAAEKSDATIAISSFGGEGGGGKAHINYTVKLNGDPTKGSCTISDGTPSFTPASA